MKVRHAELADLAKIAALERATFDGAVYPDFLFRQAFDLWREWFVVATNDAREIRGYALGARSVNDKEAWLLSLAVLASARGKGVGRLLMERLLEAMREKNVRIVRLTVHPENSAVSLYRSMGFREVETHAHYFHPDDLRVVMALMLTSQ